MTTLLGIATAMVPFLMVVALLRLADRVAARRDRRIARQIALTDAIHRELGAVAAPTVHRRAGGGWLVRITAPLDRPATTAALVRITERMFAAAGEAEGLRIVLGPDAMRPAAAGGVPGAGRRRLDTRAPAAPALR